MVKKKDSRESRRKKNQDKPNNSSQKILPVEKTPTKPVTTSITTTEAVPDIPTKSAKNKLFKFLNIAYVQAGIVIGIIASLLGILSFNYYLSDKKQNATSGIINSRNIASRNLVQVGKKYFLIDSKSGVLLYDKDQPLVSTKIVDNKLLVSAEIRNKNGDLVAELKDNVWSHQSKPVIYDRNYNDHALEIKDNTGKVVLQVIDYGYAIKIAGIFQCRNGETVGLLPMPDGWLIGSIGLWKSIYTIKPICNYPSDLNLGVCPGVGRIEMPSILELPKPNFIFSDKGGFSLCNDEKPILLNKLEQSGV